MNADPKIPRGVKRPISHRLGVRFSRSPESELDHQPPLKRQQKEIIAENQWLDKKRLVSGNIFHKDLKASNPQKDALRSSKTNISSAMEIQKKDLGIVAAATKVCTGESKSRPQTESTSAKKVSVLIPSASKTTKDAVVEELTVAAFLQKLGLSKYSITFQAEEVDMFAMRQMNDDDFKSIGLPMVIVPTQRVQFHLMAFSFDSGSPSLQGPRKKIMIALAPAKAHK